MSDPQRAHKSSQTRLQRIVFLCCVLTLIVVGLGAYTRLSDAGLGCPDWPGCYGFLSVPAHPGDIQQAANEFGETAVTQFNAPKAWKEMIHRYFAGTLSLLLVVILAISIVRTVRAANHFTVQSQPLILPALLVLLVLFQAFLGMLTVTMQLQPLIVMGHLLGGFALLSLTSLLYLRLKFQGHSIIDDSAKNYFHFSLIAMMVLVMQIALGGWLAANYAAAVCPGLPLCNLEWTDPSGLQHFSVMAAFQLPLDAGNYEYGVLSAESRLSIHLLHRFWAIFTAGFLLYLSLRLYWLSQSKRIKNSALSVAIVVILQISLGAVLVYTKIPLSIALAHNLMAALLLLTLIRLIFFIYQARSGSELSAKPKQE